MTDRWRVEAETTNGRVFVPGSEDHCRRVFATWTAPLRRGRLPDDSEDPDIAGPIGFVGVRLLDTGGVEVAEWGVAFRGEGAPHFVSLHHLVEGEWADCRTCGRLIGQGQCLSNSGDCSRCVYRSDPWRRWPRFGEAATTIPRPTKCTACRSGAKKDRRYVPDLGWYCKDCASEADVQKRRRQADG